MSKVLVTDSSERAAVSVIRSLGRKGVEVTAGDSTCFTAGSLSKYSKHRIMYPSPKKNCKKFLKYMLRLIKKEEYDLLIPITDFTAVPLSRNKEEFEPYVKVAVPEYDTLIKAFDKALTAKVASARAIPHPKTFLIDDTRDVKGVAKEIKYPAVIKPRTKVMWVDDSAILTKITEVNYAYNLRDLVAKYNKIIVQDPELARRNHLPMIQEYAFGTGYGFEALMYDAEPMAFFVHRRLREYPITGGASTLRMSVKNKELEKLGVKMLRAMNWQGVAMVEFRVNERNRKVELIEVNGRFWGSLPLAIASGVDFPWLLYKAAVMGEKEKPHFNYETGIMQRWLLPGELLWLLASLKCNHRPLYIIKEFLRSFNVPDDIVSIDDPLPVFGTIKEMTTYFVDLVKGCRTISGEIKGG